MATICKSSRAKERELFYRGIGEVKTGCYKQKVHWRKLGVRSMVAFHWLSCDSLSLAELLPGKENNFLPSAGSSKVVSFPVGDARYISSFWDLYWLRVVPAWEFPFSPPDSILVRFPFINFDKILTAQRVWRHKCLWLPQKGSQNLQRPWLRSVHVNVPQKLQKQQDKIEAQFEKEFQTFEIKCNVYEPFLAKIFNLYGACINVVEGRAQRWERDVKEGGPGFWGIWGKLKRKRMGKNPKNIPEYWLI